MRTRLLSSAVALLLAGCIDDVSPVGPPQPTQDAAMQAALVEDGRAIAEANCASCHAIGRTGASPNPKAPAFRLLLEPLQRGDARDRTRGRHARRPRADAAVPIQAGGGGRPHRLSAVHADAKSRPSARRATLRAVPCHRANRHEPLSRRAAVPQSRTPLELRAAARRLRTGIIVEHDKAEARIPPMKLTDAEIDAFLAYLDLIATRENPAPKAP